MRKFLKILLWLFSGVGLVLLALVAVLLFVDVDRFRPQIEKQVSNALGRDVVLTGPLELEPSLMPRIAVHGLEVSNPAWASRPKLASVDRFEVQVSLLPLLDRRLEIVSLEFHGVDLQLEITEEGDNNFTFPTSDEPGPVPAIERMALHDVNVAYLLPGLLLRSVHLEHATARKVPGEPIELDARTTINTVPLKLSLQAEPLDEVSAQGSWKTTLVGEIGSLSLRLVGRVGDPGDWDHGQYQVHAEGPDLDDLEKLSGRELPDAESYELDAKVGFDFDDYLKVDEFTASIGGSDLRGSIDWDIDAERPAVKIRLASRQLNIDDMGLGESSDAKAQDREAMTLDEFLDQPLDPTLFSAADLDIQVEVGRLLGLAEPVQDVQFSLYVNDSDIRLRSSTATVMGARVEAAATLPWGNRVAALEPDGLCLRTLLKHTDLSLLASGGEPRTLYSGAVMDRPFSLSISALQASVQPGDPVRVMAEGAINEQPVSMQLQAGSMAELVQQPDGPWRDLGFELRGDAIRIDATGSVALPLQAQGFDVGYSLSGDDLYRLLPLHGAYSLSGRYRDQPGSHLIDDLQIRIGGSDIAGRIAVHEVDTGTRVLARLESNRLRLDQLLPAESVQDPDPFDVNQPLEIGGLADLGLDAKISIARLDGLDAPVQDVLVTAGSRGQDLRLETIRATVDATRIDASARLPWGERLARLDRAGLSTAGLIAHSELKLQARLPEGRVRYQTEMFDRNHALALTGLDATARGGEPLKITARAELGDKPMDVQLRAEPLADLLERPTGPWRDLAMEFQVGDIGFKASGSIGQPLEGRGFDIGFQLKGAEIDTLLPLFDLILPIEGAYSIAGRVADRSDRIILDDFKLQSGRSDIGGKLTVFHAQERPRVEAELHSDQIYLRELLPVNESEASPGQRSHVIPDYDLPIDRMRAHDAEVVFRGKRLRTDAGDLGDLKFRVSLQDGFFRLAPFRVRGFNDALVEGDITIDASKDVPTIDMRFTADDANYGLLLKQAGVAEIVEGRLDVTLQLSGEGRTRREFLGDATGQLIVVGEDGRIGSRRLDLWGSDLLTTMLSPSWRTADVTKLNCIVANVQIEDGVARSDKLLMDTQRITIGASGALNLETEALNFVFAPRPKRASLVSLTNPVSVTGTLADPQVSVTVLPSNRTAAAGAGALAGLINPGYLIFVWARTGWGDANPCVSAVEEARKMKGRPEEPSLVKEEPPEDYAPFAGCSRLRR